VRYIDSLNLKSSIECFILIEPGRGYLVQALREKFKNSKVIALHVDSGFSHCHLPEVPALHGTDSMSVQDFLEKEVPEIDASLIRVIEWRPSLNYYGEAYVKLLSLVVEFIKRAQAGRRTVSAFGRRWVRNFFRNLNNIQQIILYKTMEIPVIVTGSGPGLEKALPVIRKMREGSLILAASSSIMALAHGGITADIVIASDGGPWALRHIYPYFRGAAANAVIAANLCAALPSQCCDAPRLIINDGSFWQSIVLHELALPSVLIAQKGTVTAAAVELAMLLSGGNIFLAGMDLSVRDIRTHARPYGFDHLLFESASRFSPVYSKNFVRSGLIREGGDYGIYAAWFKNKLASWPKRIFSLGGSHEVFENMLPLETAAEKNTDNYFKTVPVKDDPACFCKRGASALLAAMKDGAYAENLKAELTPLLFPGEKNVTEQELQSAITGVSYG